MNKDKTIEKGAGFTPGPWKVKYDKHGYPYVGVEADPHTYQGTVATVEQRKDARLIASAPELFAQCKLFEGLLETLQKEKGAHELCSDYEIESHDRVDEKLAQVRELLANVDGGEG
jgi:hypothetical protein